MVICVPEIRTEQRKASDEFIILACDGIWDCLTSEKCVERVKGELKTLEEGQPLTRIIETMFDDIIAADIISSQGVGTDNMTCIIVKLKPNN